MVIKGGYFFSAEGACVWNQWFVLRRIVFILLIDVAFTLMETAQAHCVPATRQVKRLSRIPTA